MQGAPLTVAWAVASAALGIWLGTIGVVGYLHHALSPWIRVAFIVAGVLTLIPADMFAGAFVTDVVGLALGAALVARELRVRRAPA
jgi:TRAP-type uncharacterized transport system fused permease subunit